MDLFGYADSNYMTTIWGSVVQFVETCGTFVKLHGFEGASQKYSVITKVNLPKSLVQHLMVN